MITIILYISEPSTDNQKEVIYLTSSEEADVKDYIQNQQKNGGALGLMQTYIDRLSKRYNTVWYVYIYCDDLFIRTRLFPVDISWLTSISPDLEIGSHTFCPD